jgi:protein O-GlcNAc transferase
MNNTPRHGPNNRQASMEALQRGARAHQAGNFAEAEFFYKAALDADGRNFDALHLMGVMQAQRGNRPEAVRLIDRAIAVNPRSAEAHVNLGRIQFEMGEAALAAATYVRALAINPNLPLALNNYAAVLRNCGQPQEALAKCDRALALQPNYAEAGINRGNALFDLKRFDEALAAYDKALALVPAAAEAWIGRGNALIELNRHDEARAAYEKTLSLNPKLAKAWFGNGNALTGLERFEDAVASYDRALAIDADFADAWHGRGNVLRSLRRFDQAHAAIDRALDINPNLPEAWGARGQILGGLQKHGEALAAYDKALSLKPGLKYIEGFRLHEKMQLCDWSKLGADFDHLIAGVNQGAPVALPFVLLPIASSPSDQLKCAQVQIADQYPRAFPPIWENTGNRHDDRINVAYLSADFRDHAVSYLMAGLFEHHDRSRFQTFAISFGPDQPGAMRSRVKSAFEQFIDATAMTDLETASRMKELEIDIAVDLTGFTSGNRAGILARRPAPIQVNYLGYPGLMGAGLVDYIIADRHVLPEHSVPDGGECVVHLPDTFQVNDSRRLVAGPAPSRAAVGLPDGAFVFCSFNGNAKVTPEIFDVWMRLLGVVGGSVLWMLANDAATEQNLRREAQNRGIAPDRLVFARQTGYADYLARYRTADLFLDTLPFNGGTTVSDALWVGVPVVTCSGEAFAARMGGSLLRAIGLPDLIAPSVEAYESLARRLATDPQLLAQTKARLAVNRASHPLFDTDRFRRHIEAAYAIMYQRHRGGEASESFAVEPVDSN